MKYNIRCGLKLFCALLMFALGFESLDGAGAETNKYAVHGRVLLPNGRPAPSAKVERDGVGLGGGRRGWGWEDDGWTNELRADANGEFTFQRDKPFAEIQIRITASNCAPALAWLPISNAVQTIQLSGGAMIRGRVVNSNQPLANVRVGMVGQDRNSEIFAGVYYATTDTNGEFQFPRLQTNTSWYLYGVISSFKDYGCLPPTSVNTSGENTTNIVPDLSVQPGLHLSGTVKTRNGEPLPKKLKIWVGDDKAWDSETAMPDTNTGRFEFSELYPGTARISIQMRDWRLTGRNRSADPYNPGSLRGLLEKDKDDLQIEIEPGSRRFDYSMGNGQLPYADQPDHRPIEGCENAAGLIVLSGQVVDDKTGQPLKSFQAIPGYKPPHVAVAPPVSASVLAKMVEPLKKKTVPWNEIPYWNHTGADTFSNGAFSVEYVPLSSQPLLRIEAEGYDPYESDPIPTSTANLVIRLKKGVGPSGIVFQPDGKPAEGATVIFAAAHEQCSFNGGALNSYGSDDNHDRLQKTGKDGSFSFPARPNGQMLFAAHPSGWAQETVANGADGLKLRLKPWAVVKGTLVYGSGPTPASTIVFPSTPATPPVTHTNGTPAAGIELHLSVPMDNFQQGVPYVNMELYATTDAQGHFEFSGVPPGRLDLVRIVRFAGMGGWSSTTQTWLIAEPDVTNDLGNVTYDTPPPLPLTEQIKQKLGL